VPGNYDGNGQTQIAVTGPLTTHGGYAFRRFVYRGKWGISGDIRRRRTLVVSLLMTLTYLDI